MYYSFKINDVEVGDPTENGSGYVLADSYIQLKKNNTKTDDAVIKLLDSVTTILTLVEGQEVKIQRGSASATETTIFIGNIKKIDYKDNSYILYCIGELNKNKYRLFTKSYDKNIDTEAGELSAIFTDIAENAGYVVDAQSSGTDSASITADKFIAINESRKSKLDLIATLLNWYYYYDYDNLKVVLQPKGYEEYGTILEVGVNVYNIPKWKSDIETMRNKITVEGAYEEDTRVDSYNADGSTDTFDFTYTPVTTNLTLNGTLQVRGISGATSSYDYTVDTDLKTFTFESTPALNDAVVMTYTTKIPKPVTVFSQTSIDKYGLTQEARYKFDDIQTVDDAETRALQLLDAFKDGNIEATLEVNAFDIDVGMIVDVVDSYNPTKSGQYIVNKIKMIYGRGVDYVTIGTNVLDIDNVFQTINERINLLEQPDELLDEILRQILQFTRTQKIVRRDFKLNKKTLTGDYLVFDHPIYGMLDSTYNFLGPGDPDNSEVVNKIQQGRNEYIEILADDNYYDSSSSTGITWNTTDKKIEFAADGELYTNQISLDVLYSNFVFNPGNITGSLTFYISFDNGSNYQEITDYGSIVNITNNATTGVIIKITEDASSTAEITLNDDDYILKLNLNQ